MSEHLTRCAQSDISVLLVGPPGIGKTARVQEAASASGKALVTIRASLSERVDLGGALVPDAATGVTRELPLATIHALQKPDCPPTILFLDDLGQAPIDVQAACMRLFDKGYLSDNVLIWGATNRPQDKAGVSALCEPLRSRFDLAYTIATPDIQQTSANKAGPKSDASPLQSWDREVDGWLDWANKSEVPYQIIAWHNHTRGRTLYQWQPSGDPAQRFADFRSWDAAARLFKAGLHDIQTLSAAIGPGAASEFVAFTALSDTLPSIDEIVANPDKAKMPVEPGPCYLMACALGAAMSADRPKQLEAFCRYLNRTSSIYKALAMRNAWRRDNAGMGRTPEFQAWFRDNQSLLGL